MTKTFTPLITIITLLALTVPPASAGRSLSRSYRMSVTLPASVALIREGAEETAATSLQTPLRFMTEEIPGKREGRTVILRTTVVR